METDRVPGFEGRPANRSVFRKVLVSSEQLVNIGGLENCLVQRHGWVGISRRPVFCAAPRSRLAFGAEVRPRGATLRGFLRPWSQQRRARARPSEAVLLKRSIQQDDRPFTRGAWAEWARAGLSRAPYRDGLVTRVMVVSAASTATAARDRVDRKLQI